MLGQSAWSHCPAPFKEQYIHRQPVTAASGTWEESYFFCEIFGILYFPEKWLENAAKKQKEGIG